MLKFIENPSLDLTEKCCKDGLVEIADHFQISVNRQSLKRKIKTFVLNGLVEQSFRFAGIW